MSIPYFNGSQPSHIMYNGVEAELYFNGEKIWPTGISSPRYEFMFSGTDFEHYYYGSMPMALQGIKVNDSLLPESAIIGASYATDNGATIHNYGPDGYDGYKALAADTANLSDWAAWKKVKFEYDNPITSVSWHTNKYGQGNSDISGVFSLRNNNANVFPPATGWVAKGHNGVWSNYFSDGTVTYIDV